MPKEEDKAVTKREDTFLIDPSQFPDEDPRDQEGYEEMPFKALTFVTIDHDHEGVFAVKNTLRGEMESVDELNMIVFGDHPHARVRFVAGNAACKSMDGITGFDPMSGEQCGKCAVCEWKDPPDKNARCQVKPIFIGDEVGNDERNGLGLIIMTFSSSAIRFISNLKSELQLQAQEAKFSARYLPLYWFILNITTELKEDPRYPKDYYVPIFKLASQLPRERIVELREQREQYLNLKDKSILVDDATVETEVKEEVTRTIYDPSNPDNPPSDWRVG
jgi:hypothetical protein